MSTIQQRRPHQAPIASTNEKTLQSNTGSSDTTPVVEASVIKTLLAFTAAMVVVPIGSYFVTVNTIFRGNSTFAGGFAAFMANVVLVGYVIVAWKEDQEDQKESGAVGTGVRMPEQKKEK
ncbi:vacuolar ATPase assembly integral membrane protein vma21 [Knufia obscura]|uniref:Vacuolar ATPase assembly integral membrane protein vma21 n=2 Tax=Knufia TaxID=430999 RepID=A0AAN8EJD9_9EURO|nr:vacuolar ATPase assembly integral membrane protein vma21 [Knufia obscura]KAK5950895.1 vacuolar ATPase assembly integral membrane protein vma21 [Knufia fluminis]